jgi:hypothetical protein
MEEYGNVTLGGEEVRWGMENLNLTAERIAEIGAEDLIQPIQITCEDHEGRGPVFIQQWNGTEWERISDWIEPMYDVLWPMYEEAALAYAEEQASKCAIVTRSNSPAGSRGSPRKALGNRFDPRPAKPGGGLTWPRSNKAP